VNVDLAAMVQQNQKNNSRQDCESRGMNQAGSNGTNGGAQSVGTKCDRSEAPPTSANYGGSCQLSDISLP
jgi:hypothetical protein